MIQSGKETQETIPEQVPLSAEEWAQTPAAVQGFVLSLLAHVQALETEMAENREVEYAFFSRENDVNTELSPQLVVGYNVP